MSFTSRSNLLSAAWNKKLILLLLTLIMFSSCSVLTAGIKESSSGDKDFEENLKTNGFYIKSVIVKKSFDSSKVKENAEYALSIIIPEDKRDIKKSFPAYVVLKEESFIKGFEQINTVSFELIIKENNDSPLKMVLISEETENTLSSYKYLYRILEKGVKEAGL